MAIFQKGLPVLFRVWVNGYWDFLSWGIFQRAECDKEQLKACDPEGHIVRVEDIQSGNEMSKMTSPQLPDWWMPDALYWWFWNLNMTQWEKWQQLSPWPNLSVSFEYSFQLSLNLDCKNCRCIAQMNSSTHLPNTYPDRHTKKLEKTLAYFLTPQVL